MTETNWRNRTLFHGDNLDFLRGMNSGTVHLIATDPPFNKGRDFHATPDSLASGARFQDRWSWADDVEGEWIDQIRDDWQAVWEVIDAARAAWGDDMAAFLCFMGVRPIEMRRVLRDDGSLYLHCDPTASHYLKALLDAVFGHGNFLNEIVWHYDGPQRPSRRNFGRKHDVILRYSKTGSYFSNAEGILPKRRLTGEELARYRRHDDGRYYYDTPRGDYTDASIERLDAEGRIRWTRGGRVRVLHFLETDSAGNPYRAKQLHDVWSDIPSIGHAGGRERTGYPTQKPLALYERIVEASSRPGNIVLDPFAGCATTPIAAERLSRQWVAMDIWENAYAVVKQRLDDNRQLLTDADPQIHYVTEPPIRTDDRTEAVPFLQVTERYAEPGGPRMTRAEMLEFLLQQHGPRCQGCDRTFDDSRYLELDHNTPRSDGGMNHITNRVLLCGPCNRLKSNQFTLSGLRRQNQRLGFMASG